MTFRSQSVSDLMAKTDQTTALFIYFYTNKPRPAEEKERKCVIKTNVAVVDNVVHVPPVQCSAAPIFQ